MPTDLFQNFWSYRSIRMNQIATDCSVLTDFVFRVLFAYFDESMGSIRGMNHGKVGIHYILH